MPGWACPPGLEQPLSLSFRTALGGRFDEARASRSPQHPFLGRSPSPAENVPGQNLCSILWALEVGLTFLQGLDRP